MKQINSVFHANTQVFFNYPFSASFTHSFIVKYALVACSVFRAINSRADIPTTANYICTYVDTFMQQLHAT